jgi:soluble lytic murein transglycosylase-like protein
MESKSTLSAGSIVGLCAIVLVLWFCFNAMGNNGKLQTGINYLKTGQTQLDYHKLARQDATNAGINPDLFERQINQESGFNPDAVSPAGAIGISQIMPSTASNNLTQFLVS